MKFAVVAHRRSATNEALVAAARAWGLDSELLDPHTALTSLEPGDVALARLDVREGLDGMERGTGELERLAAGGADVRNPPGTLIVAHYKLLTVAGEGVVPRARRARARAGGAERLGYAARGGRRECRRCCVPDRQKRRVAKNAALGPQGEPVEPSPNARPQAPA